MLLSLRYRLLRSLFRLLLHCGVDERDLEAAVLRHQLKILRRGGTRPRFTDGDRAFLAAAAGVLRRDRWKSFLVGPDNVQETGVSPSGRSGSPIVAAEAEHVERTRRKTWSGHRSEVIVPYRPLTNAVETFGGGTMLIAEFVILGALLGGVVGFGVGAALGPGPEAGAMHGLEQFVLGLEGGVLGLLIGATLGGAVGSVLKSRKQNHDPSQPDE